MTTLEVFLLSVFLGIVVHRLGGAAVRAWRRAYRAGYRSSSGGPR